METSREDIIIAEAVLNCWASGAIPLEDLSLEDAVLVYDNRELIKELATDLELKIVPLVQDRLERN